MRFFAFFAAFSTAVATVAPRAISAQASRPTAASSVGSTLSLADAIAIARRSNPAFQTAQNARRTANATYRATMGALLPSLSSSFGGEYREGRPQIISGQTFGSGNSTLGTSGSLNAGYTVALGAFAERRAQKANLDATDADISAAEQNLRAQIVNQYIAVLQDQASSLLQDTLLVTTSNQLELAKAKLQVGTGTQLDVQRADVTNGTQRVQAVLAKNQVDIDKLRLFQYMGVEPVLSTQLEPLTSMTLPAQSLEQILDMARKQNPVLASDEARARYSDQEVSVARSQYYPTLSLSAGLSGYTNRSVDTDQLIASGQSSAANSKASCIRGEEVRAALNLPNQLAACQSIAFSPAQDAAIRNAQGQYPFNFTRSPYGLSAQLSLPIFNGWRREQQIENAHVNRRNAQNNVRAQQLQLNADVTTAWLTLTTSQQTVALQEQNARTARLALSLAEERYRVGSISLVEL
ncbi:MAG: TolC family protein, partial [Gemmatimonadaceae bacterium]